MQPSSNVYEECRGPLAGLRVVEVSAFVAAPLASMTLAQLGAEVIRIDPAAWEHRPPPLAGDRARPEPVLGQPQQGQTIRHPALGHPRGQRAAADIICAGGEGAGILITNLPARGWLSYDQLSARRPT